MKTLYSDHEQFREARRMALQHLYSRLGKQVVSLFCDGLPLLSLWEKENPQHLQALRHWAGTERISVAEWVAAFDSPRLKEESCRNDPFNMAMAAARCDLVDWLTEQGTREFLAGLKGFEAWRRDNPCWADALLPYQGVDYFSIQILIRILEDGADGRWPPLPGDEEHGQQICGDRGAVSSPGPAEADAMFGEDDDEAAGDGDPDGSPGDDDAPCEEDDFAEEEDQASDEGSGEEVPDNSGGSRGEDESGGEERDDGAGEEDPDESEDEEPDEEGEGGIPEEGQTECDEDGAEEEDGEDSGGDDEDDDGFTPPDEEKYLADKEQRRKESEEFAFNWISAEELSTIQYPPKTWIIPDLLPVGLTILAGRPKSGKSILALNVLHSLTNGEKVLGEFPCHQQMGFYMGLEDHPRRIQTRLRKMGGDSSPGMLILDTEDYRHPNCGKSSDTLGRLGRFLKEEPDLRLLVIDTLGRIRSNEDHKGSLYQHDTDFIGAIQRLATSYNVAILVIHHTNKRRTFDDQERISGTTGIAGAADTLWILKRLPDMRKAQLAVTGRDLPEMEYNLELDSATLSWNYKGLSDECAEEEAVSPLRRQIIELLISSSEPFGPTAIAKALGKKVGNIKVYLSAMKAEGLISHVGKGQWTSCDPYPELSDTEEEEE